MSAITEQLPTLLGVAVGAVASVGGAALTDRFRWRRDYQRRWDNNRLQAITAYASAVKLEARLCLRVSAATWPETTSNPLPVDEGRPLVAAAEDRRSEAFEPLLLLADAKTVEAARDWQESVWRLHQLVFDRPQDVDGAVFLQKFNLAGNARERFYEAARRSLEVEGPSHSPKRWNGYLAK